MLIAGWTAAAYQQALGEGGLGGVAGRRHHWLARPARSWRGGHLKGCVGGGGRSRVTHFTPPHPPPPSLPSTLPHHTTPTPTPTNLSVCVCTVHVRQILHKLPQTDQNRAAPQGRRLPLIAGSQSGGAQRGLAASALRSAAVVAVCVFLSGFCLMFSSRSLG